MRECGAEWEEIRHDRVSLRPNGHSINRGTIMIEQRKVWKNRYLGVYIK